MVLAVNNQRKEGKKEESERKKKEESEKRKKCRKQILEKCHILIILEYLHERYQIQDYIDDTWITGKIAQIADYNKRFCYKVLQNKTDTKAQNFQVQFVYRNGQSRNEKYF